MLPTLFDNCKYITISPLFLSASAVLLIAYVVRAILDRPSKLDFPTVGSANDVDCRAALIEGSAKYPHTPFIIPTSPPTLILPLSTHSEVRNLPENKASFAEVMRRMFHAKYTGMGNDSPAMIKAVKLDLTRHVASTMDALQDEMRYALDQELGTCEDWTKVVLYQKLLRIVALLSGRIFVGRPLSRSEHWITSSIRYTVDCVAAKERVIKYPAWIRYLAVPFLPEIRRVNEHKVKGAKLLKPIVDRCITLFREGKVVEGDEGEEFDDQQGSFVSWVMKWTDAKNREDPLVLAQNQLTLSFAAIHTTTMASTHALLDLTSHPEYMAPLREEIEQVITEDGYDIDGSGKKNLKKHSFAKLKKLDSFLKESQRFSPSGLVSNLRLTTSPLHLSTGHTIPAGVRIGYNLYQINSTDPKVSPIPDPPSTAPSLDSPSTFSPFRWSSLRSIPGNESKYQFVSTSKEAMNFGHGNHACPGRFFADAELKVVMVELLTNWDIRLVGDEMGSGGKRPANFVFEATIAANPRAEVELRRRKVQGKGE
ncbi:hypothetical protein EYC80_006337 [Monilinia laxa]|uniref:Cytochrome P450 monooxygenase n=1 Tax=Monilinia laxa TaxID=61186 RepID=A0A5N6JTI0_MONLA|nr:hypothetical protein EYC80_006337 [Monilinia laxa]